MLDGGLISTILAVFLDLWQCKGSIGPFETCGDSRDDDRARQAIVHQVESCMQLSAQSRDIKTHMSSTKNTHPCRTLVTLSLRASSDRCSVAGGMHCHLQSHDTVPDIVWRA